MIASPKSLARSNKIANSERHAAWAALFLVLFFAAYAALPWVTTSSAASLTLSGVDLAEWSSLHPAVRAENPALLTSLLLRLPPVFALWIAALLNPLFTRYGTIKWLTLFMIAAGLLAVMPPLEFFTAGWARGDKNYQQQAALTLIAFLGGVLGLSGLLTRWSRPLAALIAVIAMTASLIGTQRALTLITDYGINTGIGLGLCGAIFVLAIIPAWMASSILRQEVNANRAVHT